MTHPKLTLKRIANVINAIWYLELASSILFMSIFLLSANVRSEIYVGLPLNFSQLNLRTIHAKNSFFDNGWLNTYSGTLVFHAEASFINTSIMAGVYLLIISAVLFITYQIRGIFINFKNDEHFLDKNTKSLRLIALTLITIPFVQLFFSLIVNQFLKKFYHLGPYIKLSPSFNYLYLISGILILAIVELFKLGIELQEENKLTI